MDIKPFNIVFTKRKDDYDLRIIDFGLARELKEDQISMKLTKFSGTVGETFYIPSHIIKPRTCKTILREKVIGITVLYFVNSY